MYTTEDLRDAARTMAEYDLASVTLVAEDGSKLHVERTCTQAASIPAPAPTPAAAPQQAPASAPVPGPSEPPAAHMREVCAPMVGVFYAAPAPGAEPFVHVGSRVSKGDTLCILEAMKMMNEVTADRDGEIVEVCVADGELVEYGRVLFRIY